MSSQAFPAGGAWQHAPAVKSWCDDLLANPLQQSCWCPRSGRYPPRSSRAKCCAGQHPIAKWSRDSANKAHFQAQHGQDWWIWRNLIQTGHLPRTGGTYIDLATNDPIFRSSTYFLDACLGYRGVCIEANPMHYYNIFRQRTCQLVPACASNAPLRLNLAIDVNEATGGSSTLNAKAVNRSSFAHEIACDSLTSMLERQGLRHIDLLSLDVEGHEGPVLAGLNFSRVNISVILIEPDCSRSRKSCRALRAAGYTPVRDGSIIDTVWVRKPLQASAIRSFQCDRQSSCRGWDYDGHGADYAGAPGVKWVASD